MVFALFTAVLTFAPISAQARALSRQEYLQAIRNSGVQAEDMRRFVSALDLVSGDSRWGGVENSHWKFQRMLETPGAIPEGKTDHYQFALGFYRQFGDPNPLADAVNYVLARRRYLSNYQLPESTILRLDDLWARFAEVRHLVPTVAAALTPTSVEYVHRYSNLLYLISVLEEYGTFPFQTMADLTTAADDLPAEVFHRPGFLRTFVGHCARRFHRLVHRLTGGEIVL